ncbi:peptidoglycan DD-metalloendopeptidase family protein [Paenibacillus doosanensis]|uniref:Murein DD-endopeptidase MepM n=1 Tax=Paenibacillus konkukensis TaxID=2020716 RepID=A0ABY4RQX8_9BACL|nr:MULTISPECIES: M23 family metallopeptidase [Paenibacillus]MCS7459926.1 peptidoglycan DD-metalloendopeptidase family protein [Paenibacillus doosanensis]UQZ84370.1 Murein DD-endopeptidase MepM [Paenibacillus konkukensis]
MKKSVLSLVVTAGMAGTLLVPQLSFALSESQKIQQQLDQLKKQQSTTQQKATDTKNEIGKVQTEKQQTEDEVKSLQKQIEAANLKLNELNDQIASTKDDLKENGKLLDEVKEQIASRDALLKSRLRLMYMNGVVSYADVLLSSTSFSDFLDRMNALKSIVAQDKEILEANQRDRATKETKQAQIEQELKQVSDLYSQSATVQANLVAKEKEKEVKIASLNQKEKDLESISDDQEQQLLQYARKSAQLAADKRKAAAAEEAAAAAKAAQAAAKGNSGGSSGGGAKAPSGTSSAPVATGGGKFGYPLAKTAPMSSDFGYRSDPFTGVRTLHKGIDLAAPNGTDILAAGDGDVIVASWWSGYGNTVIIDHGNGYWTLYGHIRNGGTVVEKGDHVKRGQKIAEVGSTGESTGNHVHFEVRINESPVDPKPYLK